MFNKPQVFLSECDHKYEKTHLKTHMINHSREKPLPCSECDYKCYSDMKNDKFGGKYISNSSAFYRNKINDSKSRVDQAIKDEISFDCPECDHKFVKTYQRTHMINHTGEKPLQCSICDYISSGCMRHDKLF
ncbi:unnamed protein product [Meganyctiphanes norvegica]|uniref:Zinc finger protein n=1 Tax=Meganyctiphanes norvegica TaxID=48144 RepID=A0AAV2QR48_MEGNR